MGPYFSTGEIPRRGVRVKAAVLRLYSGRARIIRGSLGEFVLGDLALSLGQSQPNLYFLRGCRIEHRTSCDLLFQRLQGPLDRKLARI
jgi:hypothetical protein